MYIQMMRHVFEQSGIKGAIVAVGKLPDNAVSSFEMHGCILYSFSFISY
jgi:katanin p80 WD40 repeat-containing subunit B1